MKQILVVDDALFMRTMIKRILKEHGYEQVLEAADGETAYAAYREYHPDLVFLDISMPRMDGLEALKKIRAYDGNAKVVMCSAVGQEAMILDAVSAGASDFIVKPFTKEQIIAAAGMLKETGDESI